MKTSLLIAIGVLLIAINPAFAQAPFKIGDKVPDFKLPFATQDTINFEGIGAQDLLGKRYILAFYPADWSPGCTKETCTFRDTMSQFEKLNVMVFGVSVDNLFSHRQWAKWDSLNFPLLSDQTHKLGEAIGVYNQDHGMFQRSIFVVGPDGKLEYVKYNYSVKDDTDFNALKQALTNLIAK